MSRTTNSTPPPTAWFMLRPPPGLPGARGRNPRSEAIFCWSLRRISSRSGGPSLFFLPHWGSFGGIGAGSFLSGVWHTGGRIASDFRERITQQVEARSRVRTYLDIQYLTI